MWADIKMAINHKDTYPLPFIVHSRFKWQIHLLSFIMNAFFISALFIPVKAEQSICVRLLYSVCILFFTFTWLHIGILRKPYVEVNAEGVSVKMLFKINRVTWEEIVYLQEYVSKLNHGIGFMTKQKQDENKTKGKLYVLLTSPYSLSFTNYTFPDIDMDKMLSTILIQCEKRIQ